MDLMSEKRNRGESRLIAIWGRCFSSDGPCAQVSLGLPKGSALLQSYLEVDAAAYVRKIWARDISLN